MESTTIGYSRPGRPGRRVVDSSPIGRASAVPSQADQRQRGDGNGSPNRPKSTACSSSQASHLEDTSQDQYTPARLSPWLECGQYQIPVEIREQASDITDAGRANPKSLHTRYANFLLDLCDGTNTADLVDHCIDVHPCLVQTGCCNLDLGRSHALDVEMDTFAYAFVIYVWQLVCLRRFHGGFPTRGEYMHRRSASYFVSACHILLKSRLATVHVGYLTFAVRCWEDRFFEVADERRWAKQPWLESIETIDVESESFRNDTAEEYLIKLEEEGITGLLRLLLDQEEDMKQSPLCEWPADEERSNELFQSMLLILASIDEQLLKAIINGQVARHSQIRNDPVGSILTRINHRSDPPPSIYINSICDEEGMSPTPIQWLLVCESMKLYVVGGRESDELAIEVDQVIYPSELWPKPATRAAARFHRYTEWDTRLHLESDLVCTHKREVIFEFVGNMRERLDREFAAKRKHTPLTAPVVEVGFSDCVLRRSGQHRQHQGSNYMMNLAEAVFEYYFPGMFHLHQHVIYHCWREIQPRYSEMLLTRLAQGYIYNAGGFSHYGAGFSNSSSFRRRSQKEWNQFHLEVWNDNFEKRLRKLQAQEAANLEAAIRKKKERRARRKRRRLRNRLVERIRSMVDSLQASIQG
ncbi:MAG: hypothetical protein Q9216_002081 [Gyalolechia sp. 2 TL-2023]